LGFQPYQFGDVLAGHEIIPGSEPGRYELDDLLCPALARNGEHPRFPFGRPGIAEVLEPGRDDRVPVFGIRIGLPEPGPAVGDVRQTVPEEFREFRVDVCETAVFVDEDHSEGGIVRERPQFLPFPDDLPLGLLLGRDVLDDGGKIGDGAVRVPDHLGGNGGVDEGAVLSYISFIKTGDIPCAPHHVFENRPFPGEVLGRCDSHPGRPFEFFAGIPQHLAELVVEVDPPAVGPGYRETHDGKVEEGAEPFLACQQRVLGMLALRDVKHGPDDGWFSFVHGVGAVDLDVPDVPGPGDYPEFVMV